MSESSKRHSKFLSLIFILKCLSKASVIKSVLLKKSRICLPNSVFSNLNEIWSGLSGLISYDKLIGCSRQGIICHGLSMTLKTQVSATSLTLASFFY